MARRLLVTYLTITALALAVVVIPLGRVFADRESDRLLFGVERDAQAVASLVEDALEAGTTPSPSVDQVLVSYAEGGGRIVVVDRDGIGVVDSSDLGGAARDFSTRPEIAAALDGQRSTGTRYSESLGTNLLYVAVPVASSGTVHGAVRITYPTSTVDARIESTWLHLGVLSLVVLAIVAAVGMVFARGVTRPVRRLQLAAGRLAAGDLEVRVDAGDGPPELRDLAETFNTTARHLELLVESQRRFVADASHQLRTPLTALRLRLETLGPAVDPAAREKLDAAIAESDRLSRLVSSLLVLARGDATAPGCEVVDLRAVAVGRTAAWEPVARDQGCRLRTDVADGVSVLAVPGAVEQMLDNLVANALDVAPPGTAVTVRAEARDDRVDLHVVDEGPGMSAEDRAHAFDRFWRPPGRPATGTGGFGLGLAIVEQLAAHCGGRARLDPGPGGRGLDAVVVLRRSTGSAPATPVGHGIGASLTGR